MLKLTPLYRYSLMVGAITLGVVAIAVWYSYPLDKKPEPQVLPSQSAVEQPIPSNTVTDKTRFIDKKAPAPAKKLQQLLTKIDREVVNNLDQHVENANASVAEINRQLEAQGSDISHLPFSQTQEKAERNDADIRQRLNAIQAHINNTSSK